VLLQGFYRGVWSVGVVHIPTGVGDVSAGFGDARVLTVYFGAPSMFITLWFGFDYGTNPPLGTLII
jgi:hypothetical protein